MEEFVLISGELIDIDIASEITGLTQDELRKSKSYYTFPIPEQNWEGICEIYNF